MNEGMSVKRVGWGGREMGRGWVMHTPPARHHRDSIIKAKDGKEKEWERNGSVLVEGSTEVHLHYHRKEED